MGVSFRRVVAASGHMIDTPERPEPRFPAWLEPVVAHRIEVALDHWGIGAGDALICGTARGADLLFAESALRRRSTVFVDLALPADEFETTSVTLADSIWVPRFRWVLDHAEVHTIDTTSVDVSPFEAANLAMIDRALAACPPAELCVALVWDRRPTTGPGGTGEFAELATRHDVPLTVIDPLPLIDRHRKDCRG